MRKLSKAACFKCLTGFLYSNIKSVLVAGTNFYTFLCTALNDFFCICHAHCHRLFNNYIYAMLNTIKCNFCMKT